MKKYFLTRLALALPVILLVSVFSFALVFLAPGDPAAQYRTLEMTDEEYEQLKTELGYNDPVIVQYGRWMGKVLQGDFGVSTSSHTGVWPLIKAKLPATVGLMAASIVDAVGEKRTQNQPGTNNEYPNWRIPLADGDGNVVPLEKLFDEPRLQEITAIMRG